MTELLRTVNLTKSFSLGRREIPVLRGVDLAVQEGEILALLGESGAGKSTLLHLLGLLDTPTDGQVLYQGQSVQELSEAERARLRHRQIGFVFQFYHLIPELTALQNVKLGERQRVAIARALISDPRVILADEPTGNLDSTTAHGVLDILFRLNREQNIAFVIVTHNHDLAQRCDRVVQLKDGVVVH